MLKEILSISGKPGLQKLISNSSNAIIVESLIDGKRFPAYSNSKIIALEDISIYTEAEDMPLKEVFKRISAKENGKSALSHKEPTEKILAYFEEIVPEYDKERVYVSDMKKIIQWYNLLTDKGMLDLDEEAKEEEKKEKIIPGLQSCKEGGHERTDQEQAEYGGDSCQHNMRAYFDRHAGAFCEKRNKYRPRGRIPPAERSRREPVPTRYGGRRAIEAQRSICRRLQKAQGQRAAYGQISYS